MRSLGAMEGRRHGRGKGGVGDAGGCCIVLVYRKPHVAKVPFMSEKVRRRHNSNLQVNM